jgi:hypothetical protein
MSGLLHIGFNNLVNTDKIVAILSPDSAPVKRMITHAKDTGKIIDATQGRKTKAVIVCENDSVMLCALTPETIASRAEEE